MSQCLLMKSLTGAGIKSLKVEAWGSLCWQKQHELGFWAEGAGDLSKETSHVEACAVTVLLGMADSESPCWAHSTLPGAGLCTRPQGWEAGGTLSRLLAYPGRNELLVSPGQGSSAQCLKGFGSHAGPLAQVQGVPAQLRSPPPPATCHSVSLSKMCLLVRMTFPVSFRAKAVVVSDSVTLWTVAHQAPLSRGLSRQEYWSGLLFPPPGHLPNPGIEPRSPTFQADSLPSKPPGQQIGKQPTKWGPKLMSQQTHSTGF